MNQFPSRFLESLSVALLLGVLVGCSSVSLNPTSSPEAQQGSGAPVPSPATSVSAAQGLPTPILQARSRWIAVPWADLPGLESDPLFEAWNAWLKSCERPGAVFAPLCVQVRRLSIADTKTQRDWLMAQLQPYRVEPLSGPAEGLLTAYYEPVLEGRLQPNAEFSVPLYQTPIGLNQRKPWYTRQEMETLPAAQAALKGREIAYLSDPVDALLLQIQGSGRVRLRHNDGSVRLLRLAFAGSNEQPYKSVGRWLLDQGALRDVSWPAIKAWVVQNPTRVNELLWSNPRTVFFREDLASDADAGPKGAQGVALTPGRSIAVDPLSIPYGTPVWLASDGVTANLQKLVVAQDTGSAIMGAVRADYFAGVGEAAGELAGRLKQPLRLWVLWPK